MMFNGILDISHYQSVSSFHAVKDAGIAAIIHKATQGTKSTDPKFIDHFERCKKVGLLDGAYHFGTNASGAQQAKHFLSRVKSPNTLLMLDWEGNGSDTMTAVQAEEFVATVKAETGKPPVLYSGQAFLAANIPPFDPSNPLFGCSLWIARYSLLKPKVPKGYSNWALWQYTSSAKVPGILGRVDRNRFNGSEAEFRSWWERRAI